MSRRATSSQIASNWSGFKASKDSLVVIQVLRGVAAVMVVLHHATVMVQQRLHYSGLHWQNGAAGVDIFFVISGFVMALSSRGLVGKSHPAREFLKRRLQRIVPLYWLATAFKVVLLLALPGDQVNGLGSAWNILASFVFLPSFNAAGLPQPVLIVGWTLNFEMMFYVWFAGALELKMRPIRLLVPVMTTLALLALVLPPTRWAAASYFNTIVLEFIFGMGLHWLYARGHKLGTRAGAAAMVLGFAVLMVAPENQWRGIQWGLPALAVVAGAVGLEGRIGELVPRWLREIGDSSYSVYLAHGFALPIAGMMLVRMHLDPRQVAVPAVVFSLVLSLMAGELVYRTIEQPIALFFQRQRRRVAAAEGHPAPAR